MEIYYSQRMRKIAESYGLRPDELAFADLIAAGWDRVDAYYVAMRIGDTWTKQSLERTVRELAANAGVKKRIKELRITAPKEKNKLAEEEEEDNTADLFSKESMLKDLYKARNSMRFGSKEWLDTNKMIADITRMKQEEIKTEDNTVHYYIPLTCHKCSLYQKKQ